MLPPKKPKRKPGFLPSLPAGDLTAWRDNHRAESSRAPCVSTPDSPCCGVQGVTVDGRTTVESQQGFGLRQKRLDMPVVRKRKVVAMPDADAMGSHQGRSDALQSVMADMYAATSRKPREAQLTTWIKFHTAWFGASTGDPFNGAFPLNEDKILRVSALFKASGYRSYKNYLSRAKDQHLTLGYEWSDHLTRVAQKCTRSVLRGLAGSVRSEAFEFVKVVEVLQNGQGLAHDGAPVHPLPMIVTATYFMLRELEVSAVELSDVTFTSDSVSLHLPVSKTDWAAKGCTRTWSCICDRDLPCPYHILRRYVDEVTSQQQCKSGPLFVSRSGTYCTKDGVVAVIRWAAGKAGQEVTNLDGEHLLSGHTFRITGARFLSSIGLDAITIQLLGRWGSDAVLTYLAEAPLQGLANRIRPLAQSSLKQEVRNQSDWRGNQLDERVKARRLLELEKERMEEVSAMKASLLSLERKTEDLGDAVQGMAITLDTSSQHEVWHVKNTKSFVMHKDRKSVV